MILLKQNRQEFNNDLRAMIMAFYPGIKIVEKLPQELSGKNLVKNVSAGRTSEDAECLFTFEAEYSEDETRLAIYENTGFEHDVSDSVSSEDGSVFEGTLIASKKISGDYREKQSFRNRLKMASYELLCEKAGRVLPWGDLTGVRPTKIAMKQLAEGRSFDEAVENYIEVYSVSDRKARLAAQVAQKELSIISDIDIEDDYCLYIGIPFCPTRCLYCSFTSYPIALYQEKSVKYIDKLCEELSFIASTYRNKNLVSVYVGGGTPTSINHELLDLLLTHIEKTFDTSRLKEFTVEAGRPDSITEDKLHVMRKHNVTRISINPQTMNDETLKTIGRAHTAEQTRTAFAMARQAGFDNINMDLIAGLPNENADSMRLTLEEVKKLSPESITVHSLAIKRAANLRQQMSEYGAAINHNTDEMLDMVSDMTAELGMEPYYLYRQKNIGGNLENVGYSVNGSECLYNILIMEELTDIIAAGAGASTKLTYHSENRVERVENCKSVDDYIERFDEMLARKQVIIDKQSRD